MSDLLIKLWQNGILQLGIWETIYMTLISTFFAYLIGLPVLRLKSDYLAIATLGFAEIIRSILQWGKLGPVTNGSNMLKSFTRISNFKIGTFSLSTFVPVLIAVVSIGLIVMLVNSTYGRAFKAIRDDEIAASASGINITYMKVLVFAISAFFAGIAGGIFQQPIGKSKKSALGSKIGLAAIKKLRKPVNDALEKSSRLQPPADI